MGEFAPQFEQHIREAFRALPPNYVLARRKALELGHCLQDTVAVVLAPLLQAHLSFLPADTIEQKRAVASWCNGELHELNLAIRCPRTGKAAILLADTHNAADGKGRFRLSVRDGEGKLIRTGNWSEVPTLALMQARARTEPFAKPRGGSERGR